MRLQLALQKSKERAVPKFLKQTEIMEYEFQLRKTLTAAKTTSWIWTLEILSHNLHLLPEQQLPLRWILGECQSNKRLPNSLLNSIPGVALPQRRPLLLVSIMIPGLRQKNLRGRLQTW